MLFLKKHRENIILTLILIGAAFLRLYHISAYLTFLGDEGRDALVVKGILEGHFTLLGPRASAGDFYTGPIYYYMMAPFLWLFHYSPVGPAVMIALLSVATAWFIYFLCKQFINRTAGCIAALLYAVSPLVILYSHSSWNPNPMPFFTLFLFYILYLAVKKKSWKYYLGAGFLYGIILQLHYIEVFTGVIIFFFVGLGNIHHQKIGKKDILQLLRHYGSILGGFLIGFSPFILFELRHNFENTLSIANFILHGDPGAINLTHYPFWQTIYIVFTDVFGHLIYNYPLPSDFHNFTSQVLVMWMGVVIVVSLIAIYYLRYIKDKLFVRLLLLWFFFGITLFSFYHKPIYDYYYEFMFPLPFILYGNFLSRVFFVKKWQPLLKILVGLFLICDISYLLWTTPIRFPANHQMDQMRHIAEFVIQRTDNQPFNFAILSKGNSPHAYLYFFHIEHRDPVMIDNLINDPQRKTVTDQLFVVCETLPCQPIANPDFPIAGFGQAKIAGMWDISVVKIYKLAHY